MNNAAAEHLFAMRVLGACSLVLCLAVIVFLLIGMWLGPSKPYVRWLP